MKPIANNFFFSLFLYLKHRYQESSYPRLSSKYLSTPTCGTIVTGLLRHLRQYLFGGAEVFAGDNAYRLGTSNRRVRPRATAASCAITPQHHLPNTLQRCRNSFMPLYHRAGSQNSELLYKQKLVTFCENSFVNFIVFHKCD